MLNLGEFCKECLCARCEYRKSCGTLEGNTDWYCREVCKGNDGCMKNCSQFKLECFLPEEDNPYPLCVGRNLKKCKDCQMRADWEPEEPYGVERYCKLWREREESESEVKSCSDKK